MARGQALVGFFGLVGTLVALLYQPVYQRAIVLGFTRPQHSISNVHGVEALKVIPDTIACEDLHHHRPSDLLFTACQDDKTQHFGWFPAVGNYKDPKRVNKGSLTIVDPKTFTSKKLKLKGFKGPFITHGIDIWSSSEDPQTVYIFAINHLPNPLHYDTPTPGSAYPSRHRSQIELFKHEIGSDDAQYLRSIRHPLIRTPNDLVAVSSNQFYVTNDHYYPEGFLRNLEDGLNQQTAAWTDIVHVEISDLNLKDPEAGLEVSKALTGMHNNNGLGVGHPSNPAELVIVDASGGVMHRALRPLDSRKEPTLQRIDSFQLQTTLDNPSHFVDEYATKTNNASGYVLAGLARAGDLSAFDNIEVPQPAVVWHLRQDTKPSNLTIGGWTPHLIFQDEGHFVRTATTAVLLGIDPEKNGGKKQGWLFTTGFLSDKMVASKIDL
ncbi:MAG: hypothetical protein Q9159_006147 [Coniocarpon cinnabarinum]